MGTGKAWAGQLNVIAVDAGLINLEPSFSDENFGNDPPIGSTICNV